MSEQKEEIVKAQRSIEELRANAPLPVQQLYAVADKLPSTRERSIAITHLDNSLVLLNAFGPSTSALQVHELRLAEAWLAHAPRFAGKDADGG